MKLSTGTLGLIIYFAGACGFTLQQQNFLSVLLYLEVCNIGVYVILSSTVGVASFLSNLLMLYLCMVVCESAVGMAVLVMVAHSHGNDYVSTTGILTL